MSEYSLSPLRLIQSQTLPSLIQKEIESLIIQGLLQPGAKLSEIHLAERFGVSRGPIREALRGLQEKLLVRVEKNRGVFVREISLVDADRIYEVRLALEGRMGYLAAERRTSENLAGLESAMLRAEAAALSGDYRTYYLANLSFHEQIASCADNLKLTDIYQRLVNELSLYRWQSHVGDKSSLIDAANEHRKIFFAIASGDPEIARDELELHVEAGRSRLHASITNF